MWKLETQRGKRMTMATERAATRRGMARSIAPSALCRLSFDGGIPAAAAGFFPLDPSSRRW